MLIWNGTEWVRFGGPVVYVVPAELKRQHHDWISTRNLGIDRYNQSLAMSHRFKRQLELQPKEHVVAEEWAR